MTETLNLVIPIELYELLEKEAQRRRGSVSQAAVALLRDAMQPPGREFRRALGAGSTR